MESRKSGRAKYATVNKLRDRHPPEAMVNQKREGVMGKKPVLKPFETW
jgi:hypothetical protein